MSERALKLRALEDLREKLLQVSRNSKESDLHIINMMGMILNYLEDIA